MKYLNKLFYNIAVLLLLGALSVHAHSGPFDGKNFKGRIAFSSDGNFNDEDDWGAFPVAMAILHTMGVNDQLVHVDYNNILPSNDDRFYREMTESVTGAIERWAVSQAVAFDCQRDLEGAVENIKNVINASSADNPLYYVLAGPMEVPARGIELSDPEKRKFVYCISHNNWNDGYASGELVEHNKRDVIPSGVNWIQIRDGNRYMAHPGQPAAIGTPEQWARYQWLKDSTDEGLRWIFSRLEAELRPDISDSTMTYFLMTGDEDADLPKMKRLLDDKVMPTPISERWYIRLEAENFRVFENVDVLYDRRDRSVSQRLCVLGEGFDRTGMETLFDEPYTADHGIYDIHVRTFAEAENPGDIALSINGVQQGRVRKAADNSGKWTTFVFTDLALNANDKVGITANGLEGKLVKFDYVELHRKPVDSKSDQANQNALNSLLDDPNAMPGQIIVAGENPGYLKYNGAGPAFLSGPDNPEDFLFTGELRPDGTRVGGGQVEMIQRMADTGLNAFHCQMFRMQRCNFKNEGDDTHAPFLNHDPSQPLNNAVLDQWESWFDLFEANNIVLHLEFYNDATDVEMMGWEMGRHGDIHPDEKRFIQGIVRRFKHHKNIMWGIEESANKLAANNTRRFKIIGQVIADEDNFNHPIVQSFVVDNDPEGDNHPDGVMNSDYKGDPNIRVVTWLHVRPHKDDFEAQHQEYLRYYAMSSDDFVVLKNETYHHPRDPASSRRFMWSCAMTGMHALEAYHSAGGNYKYTPELLVDDGRINTFMEQTDFHRMKPNDKLAAGSTRWVLANPGESYIAYTYDYSGSMGVKGLKNGSYNLKWFDTTNSSTLNQSVEVGGGDTAWKKPDSMGDEIALYIQRAR
jgi:hypothetical protein